MKVTEIRIYPMNKQPIVENSIEGDFNLLNSAISAHIRSLDKNKLPYIFRFEEEGKKPVYSWNLNKQELAEVEKYLPELHNNNN